MTKFSKTSTGKYSVSGKTYEMLIGTRAQVWHGTAYKTTGGLTHGDLMKNKTGRIVSKSKHNSAKREKRLVKAGYLTKKGHFGFIKKGKTMKRKHRGGSALGHHAAVAHHAAITHHAGTAHKGATKGGAMPALNPANI